MKNEDLVGLSVLLTRKPAELKALSEAIEARGEIVVDPDMLTADDGSLAAAVGLMALGTIAGSLGIAG